MFINAPNVIDKNSMKAESIYFLFIQIKNFFRNINRNVYAVSNKRKVYCLRCKKMMFGEYGQSSSTGDIKIYICPKCNSFKILHNSKIIKRGRDYKEYLSKFED